MLWYGSSILQGAVASRPGQIMTHIVSRNLKRVVYNFGFSGNCWMETSVAQYLAAVYPRPGLIVIDCNPNMVGFNDTSGPAGPPSIYDRAIPLVKYFRENGHPNTPIIMTEGTQEGATWAYQSTSKRFADKRRALRSRFNDLVESGDRHLYYSKGPPIYSSSLGMAASVAGGARLLVDPTVGGTHPTDLGMRKQASWWSETIPKILVEDAKKP